MVINRPVKFPGTEAEAAANFATHKFIWGDDDTRCWDCDCRPSYISASWPCGAEVPREIVTI